MIRLMRWIPILVTLILVAGCRRAEPPEPPPADTAQTIEPATGYEGMIFDVHTHLIGPESWPDIEAIIEAENIGYFLNLSGGNPRRGMTAALALSELFGGRILNAMTINWDGVDEVAFGEILAEELTLCVERYGYVALKVSKALGLFVRDADDRLIPVDDPRLFPLWRRAGELGVPVFIHTADPAAFWEPIGPENERFAELRAHPSWSFAHPEYPPREVLLRQRDHLLELFPETTFVGVHFANNPEDVDWVAERLERYPNLYVDISARVPELGRHDPARVREIFEQYSHRILFGTDLAVAREGQDVFFMLGSTGEEPDTADEVPVFFEAHRHWLETDERGIAHPTPIQGDWTVDAIGLSSEVLQRIYYENAAGLLLRE